jgi:cell division transport system permease protein
MAGRLQRGLHNFAGGHLRALVASLGRLYRAPLPSLITAAVIGIALALPAVFLLVLVNVQQLAGSWEGGARLSLFIHADVEPARYRQLADQLAGDAQISATSVITPEAALEEFRQSSGLQDALALLDENPLPPVIVAQPVSGLPTPTLEALAERLRELDEVALVQLDRAWVQRLRALLELLGRGIWIVAGLLAATVILVVGNTIRLDIQDRRDEIIVTKLIGGTDAFIRRPFLYEGIWYGVLGGVLAGLLVELGRLLLSGPARELALLYGSGFALRGLGFDGFILLFMASALLGLLGSWLAVGRHLAAIEPQ